MGKYLPIFLFLGGIVALGGVYFFVIRPGKETVEKEEIAPEIPFSERPVASFTPSEDGHWLKLIIDKIKIEAATLDYELLYEVPDGRPSQGVPGTIKLTGETKIERDLLLGSESSGKFRYDEGVTQGTLTLRFRNERGKLVAKFVSKFHLQSGTKELTSLDGKFAYTLAKTPKAFFVTMETFGVPQDAPGPVSSGPYGVFSSAKTSLSGNVKLPGVLYHWTGSSWEKLENGKSDTIGIFVGTSE